MTGVQAAGHEVLGGIGVDGDAADAPSQPGTGEQLPGPPPRLTQADMERMLKDQKKAVKRAHKAAKKVCLYIQHTLRQYLPGSLPLINAPVSTSMALHVVQSHMFHLFCRKLK